MWSHEFSSRWSWTRTVQVRGLRVAGFGDGGDWRWRETERSGRGRSFRIIPFADIPTPPVILRAFARVVGDGEETVPSLPAPKIRRFKCLSRSLPAAGITIDMHSHVDADHQTCLSCREEQCRSFFDSLPALIYPARGFRGAGSGSPSSDRCG